jgi:hypothetical protein
MVTAWVERDWRVGERIGKIRFGRARLGRTAGGVDDELNVLMAERWMRDGNSGIKKLQSYS